MRFLSPLRSAQNDIPDFLTFAKGLFASYGFRRSLLIRLLRPAFSAANPLTTVTATEISSEIEEDDDGIEYKDVRTDAIARMQQARQMIRSYTIYALSVFKDFNTR